MWSCCFQSDIDQEGCMEEHSVNLRSVLGESTLLLNDNRLLPLGGDAWRLSPARPHNELHRPRYAFWSTERCSKTGSIDNTIRKGHHNTSSLCDALPCKRIGTAHRAHREHPDHNFKPKYSTHTKGDGLNAAFASALQRKQCPIGEARIESGTITHTNRPMTAPVSYKLHCRR